MGNLTAESAVFFLIAGLIGALLGWMLRGRAWKSREAGVIAELRNKVSALDKAEIKLAELNALKDDLRVQLSGEKERSQSLAVEMENIENKMQEQENEISRVEANILQLKKEKNEETTRLQNKISSLEAFCNAPQEHLNARHPSRKEGDHTESGEEIPSVPAGQNKDSQRSGLAMENRPDKNAAREAGPHSREPRPAEIESPENVASPFDSRKTKDDLTKIFGIGPALEKTLNQLGIQTYEQIARFTPEDVKRIGEALGAFPDRIERDDWIGGAQKQYLAKYGKSI